MRLLFTVSDVFSIQGQTITGIALVPELVPIGQERFKVGDPLRLKLPDGSEEIVPIGGLELAKVLNAPCKLLVFLDRRSREDGIARGHTPRSPRARR